MVENFFFFIYNAIGNNMSKKNEKPGQPNNQQRGPDSLIPSPGTPFSSLFREVKDMIYRMSLPDGTYTYVSPASAAVLGYTPEECYHSPQLVRETIHPDWHGYFREQWANLLAGIVPPFYEYQVIHKSGEVRWMQQSNVLVKDEKGNPVAIEGIVRDVTKQKVAETKFEEWKNRYEAAVLSSHNILYDWDSVTNEVIYGGDLESILGYTYDQMAGGLPRWQSLIHPDDKDHFQEVINKIIATKEPAYLSYRVRKKNGDYIHVEDSGRFFSDSKGNIVRMVGFVKDISQRKRMEADKRKLEEQLRQSQKMQAIGTLAGGIAHDFNNILAIIIGYAEISLRKYGDGGKLTGNLNHILASANRAKNMVDQILMFSRKSEKILKPLNLGAVVKEAVKFLRSTIPTSIEIGLRIEVEENEVLADQTELHQVVMNLITNAAHAIKDKNGLIDIQLKDISLCSHSAEIKDLPPGQYFQLSVADDGAGMPEHIRNRVFEPYFTTKNPGKGTGMGLAVVHGIVKSHGGEISVYSEEGKGSIFSVFLPVIPESKHKAGKSGADMPLLEGTERILFVDDEKDLVESAKEILESLGYKVTTETDSSAALEEFKNNNNTYDLLITDMTMPHLTGLQLIEAIREITPGFPVILCTGFSDVINAENYARHGINRFVMKPLNTRELSVTVRQVLDGPKLL